MTMLRHLTDDAVKAAVLEELSWEPSVSAAHIGVTARDGVVTLSGNVKSYFEKHAAERAAERVNGVKAVAETIEVRLPFETKHRDEEIAAAAVSQMKWDSGIPADTVKIKVENGIVTLSGQLDYHFQKEAAEQLVRRLSGVVNVFNQITINVKANALNISNDIQHALHRSWLSDPELVHVTAQDGRVKLTGTVGSFQDRQTAGATAWSAHGATSVENDILVG